MLSCFGLAVYEVGMYDSLPTQSSRIYQYNSGQVLIVHAYSLPGSVVAVVLVAVVVLEMQSES